MGLAGRKVKQRIRADPRNLTWSDDSSKFGEKYLKSLGWTSGTGLGASGEGRVGHVKVHQKLDLMGIGANRRSADDAGWAAGRNFEGLLARLNQAQEEDARDAFPDSEDGAVGEGQPAAVGDPCDRQGAGSEQPGGHSADKSVDAQGGEADEVGKKRKRKKSTMLDETKEAKRKKKDDSGRKHKDAGERDGKVESSKESESGMQAAGSVELVGEAKRRKKAKSGEKHKKTPKHRDEESKNGKESEGGEQAATTVGSATPRYRAHRAHHLAAKRLAASSEASMKEILGIAPATASGDPLGLSSIPFPMLDSPVAPRRHPVKDDGDGEGAAPGLGSRASRGRLEQAAHTADAHAALSTCRGSHVDGSETNGGHEGQDTMLRTNGKTISEYFAKKIASKVL